MSHSGHFLYFVHQVLFSIYTKHFDTYSQTFMVSTVPTYSRVETKGATSKRMCDPCLATLVSRQACTRSCKYQWKIGFASCFTATVLKGRRLSLLFVNQEWTERVLIHNTDKRPAVLANISSRSSQKLVGCIHFNRLQMIMKNKNERLNRKPNVGQNVI